MLPQISAILHKRFIRSLLAAGVLATGITVLAHTVVTRQKARVPFAGGWGGTVYIDGLLGLPKTCPEMEPNPMSLEDPKDSIFFERVCERSRVYLGKPSSRYEVWMVKPKTLATGWPFESRAMAAMVVVDEYPALGESQQHIFWADESGSSPIRYGGLLANWSLYFAASGVFAWLGDMAVCAIIRRRRRRRRGFPVVPVEKENA